MKRISLALALFFASLTAHAVGPIYVVTAEAVPACLEKNTLTNIFGMIAEGDTEAWQSELARRLARGECAMLKKGTKLYFKDGSGFQQLLQARPHGKTSTYWLPSQAAKQISD